jgi:hypothetical protein
MPSPLGAFVALGAFVCKYLGPKCITTMYCHIFSIILTLLEYYQICVLKWMKVVRASFFNELNEVIYRAMFNMLTTR